ncbi:MAG: hypothetical protein AABW58_00785 [Nanoarchaeota archaeon]
MKKGFFMLFFLILFSISAFGQDISFQNNFGVNICGVPKNCGVADGICPEDFFSRGVECYIDFPDPDCCQIDPERTGWSRSKTEFLAIEGSYIAEGTEVFMYAETKRCEGKDATFKVFVVEDRAIFGDNLLDTADTRSSVDSGPIEIIGPLKSDGYIGVGLKWISYTDPAAITDGVSKFRFKVKINPEFESEDLEVGPEGTTSGIVHSCNDLIDNDADGCADEPADCTDDNTEGTPDYKQCPVCTTAVGGVTPACDAKCRIGNEPWQCHPGDCLDGTKSTGCPPIPDGCPLTQPPKFVKCYERLVPFPFYDNFNLVLSILSLIGYYGFRIKRNK